MSRSHSETASSSSRRNGARSKGPKSDTGKAKSSRNAFKHGLRSAVSVQPLAMPVWLKDLERELGETLGPALLTEKDQIDTFLLAQFRLRQCEELLDQQLAEAIESDVSATAQRLSVLMRYEKRFRGQRDRVLRKLLKNNS